ncbi:MAG: anion transporter [Clostridium sp.]|nr:anion transporter [Clostridium sp.]
MFVESLKQERIISFIKREIVLSTAGLLAIVSSLFNLPKLEYINFKVLIVLFNLMIIISAFKESKILDFFALKILSKCDNYKKIAFTLIFITFFSSMLITNDVALLTFVPLTLILCKKLNKDPLILIVLQTIAANLGSSFTPLGNPQNLFLYNFYNYNIFDFFKITFPIFLASLIFLIVLIMMLEKSNLNFESEDIKIKNKKHVMYFSLLFILVILSVMNIIDYKITFLLTLISAFFINKDFIKDVDYSLLLTFIFFFIFIGNLSSFDIIKNFMSSILNNFNNSFFASIFLSQIISNVPCAMLLSSFTNYSNALILGTNIGGLGTLIASMASLISYKLYIQQEDNSKEFLKVFTLYNVITLIFLILVTFLIMFSIH